MSEPISEDRRLALVLRLIEVLGEEEARTIMESLPPTPWTHLATKDDLKVTEERMRAEMEKNKGEIALMIANQTRTLMLALTGVALSIWISLLVVRVI